MVSQGTQKEQQEEGRWSTGHRYLTSGVLQLPQKMVQAVTCTISRAKVVFHWESTPASGLPGGVKQHLPGSDTKKVKGDGARAVCRRSKKCNR